MNLQQHPVGGLGLCASRIGVGCMGMSQSYGHVDERQAIETLHLALESGCNFLDTAEVYGPYANEELLGRALSGRRQQAVIATKFGFKLKNGKIEGLDSRPAHIRETVDQSLRRLQTDYIDLVYQHRVDPKVPIEDVAGTIGDLVAEGKVRYFGLSEAGAGTIERAHSVFPVSAVQSEYSLWERNLDLDIVPLLRRLGIALIAFSPLGRGFLTAQVKRADDYGEADYRRRDPRFHDSNFDGNMAATAVLRRVAADHDATAAQVALAWVLAQGEDIFPIPGTKSPHYLKENLAAVDLRLDGQDLADLDAVTQGPGIHGERYSAASMGMIER